MLYSKELKKALESQDAVVRAAALEAEAAAKERLFALEQGVPEAALDANISYDDAYKAAAKVAAKGVASSPAGDPFDAPDPDVP
jgi:hypothetical protein